MVARRKRAPSRDKIFAGYGAGNSTDPAKRNPSCMGFSLCSHEINPTKEQILYRIANTALSLSLLPFFVFPLATE
jgi:hypothetical protein